MKKQKWVIGLAVPVLSTVAFLGYQKWAAPKGALREELLAQVPSDARVVIFLDFDELRRAPFIARLYSWAPKPQSDADYAQFLKDTGFDYERDLNRLAIATTKRGQESIFFAIADGKFDRPRLSAYASKFGAVARNGGREIYSVPVGGTSKKISFAFPKNNRIVMTDGTDISVFLDENNRKE